MRGLGELITFVCTFCVVAGQLPAPENLKAFAESDGALIRFDPVAGAVAYLGVLGSAEASSVESTETQLYFGELEPLTEYTVFVSAIDESGDEGEPNLLVFTTGVGEIANFRVVTVSSSLMTLEWDPMDGVDSYIIDPVEDKSMPPIKLVNTSDAADVPCIPNVQMTGDASARLTGLKPMTYYKIVIRGIRDTDLGPTSTLRARTDGEGLVLYNMWTDHNEVVIGGSGTIFKPLEHPSGPYRMRVEFPCPLQDFELWEAVLENDNATDAEPGVYNILQDEVWMQEKNEVGFNFYTIYNETSDINCDFDPRDITVVYDIADEQEEATEEFDIPYEFFDWGGAGILSVKLSEIVAQPNQARDEFDTRQIKPDRYKMALSITKGPNCTDFVINDCWNVDRIYNSSVENGGDSVFFVQSRDMWFSNDIGIVISYSEGTCPDRNGITVSFLSGGNLILELQENYDLQEVKGTCSDDPFEDILF